MMELLITFLISVSIVAADARCSPATIHLGKGTIMATSQDNYYNAGDIFNRNCSGLPRRKYIGWCPSPHDNDPKIQINIPATTAVHGLVFQTSLASCPSASHNFGTEAFLETFDLQYVLPGDNSRTLMSYGEDLPALDGTSAEKTFRFDSPLVTSILTLTMKSHNIYPCFRFAVLGCAPESLCPDGYCENGGTCAGRNFCTCTRGFVGDRCNMTANDIEQEDYSFMEIKDHKLITPYAEFDVVGDITLINGHQRRDGHHHNHHHGHSCHFHGHHGHHSYCQYGHSTQSSHGQGHAHGHGSSHCMHGLTNHHHGFTTSLNVNFGHNHHGHHYIYSNGGHLHGHHGCSLSHNTITNTIKFIVSTVTHKWEVITQAKLPAKQTHDLTTSWHPQTGAHVYVNNQHVGSCGHPKPHSKGHTNSVPLRLGDGHVTIDSHFNLNMSISGLNMYPVPAGSLAKAGVHGPYTPAPPTSMPQSTTTAHVSATTTHGPQTTKLDHRPVCYTYTNEATIGASKSHTRCSMGEVCALFQDKNGYSAKCLGKNLCSAGKRMAVGSCWECCDTYLCNDNCSASTAGQCADKTQCAVMLFTGYDVCAEPKLAVDICSKTCKIC